MKYVTITGLAEHLAVSISTVRQWVRNGHIPEGTYIKVGTTYRFDLKAVERALITGKGEKQLHSGIYETDLELSNDDL